MTRSLLLTALLLGGVAAPADAASILYFNDLAIGADRMGEALAALAGTHNVTSTDIPATFTAELETGSYDLAIFFQQNALGPDYDAAWLAIGAFLAAGGSAIATDWTQDPTHSAVFEADFTGALNQMSFIVTDPTLASGVANPVDLMNPGWGVFSTGLGGAFAALFPNGDGAIVVGNQGRSLFNGFLSDTFADGAEGRLLYINEIGFVLGERAVPEPAALLLMGAAISCAVRRRRRGLTPSSGAGTQSRPEFGGVEPALRLRWPDRAARADAGRVTRTP